MTNKILFRILEEFQGGPKKLPLVIFASLKVSWLPEVPKKFLTKVKASEFLPRDDGLVTVLCLKFLSDSKSGKRWLSPVNSCNFHFDIIIFYKRYSLDGIFIIFQSGNVGDNLYTIFSFTVFQSLVTI